MCGLGSLLSWAVFLYFSNLATITLLSSYPYAILVRVTDLLASHGSLHSCTDLLCLVSVLVFLSGFVYVSIGSIACFNSIVLPSLCCLALSLGRIGEAE